MSSLLWIDQRNLRGVLTYAGVSTRICVRVGEVIICCQYRPKKINRRLENILIIATRIRIVLYELPLISTGKVQRKLQL